MEGLTSLSSKQLPSAVRAAELFDLSWLLCRPSAGGRSWDRCLCSLLVARVSPWLPAATSPLQLESAPTFAIKQLCVHTETAGGLATVV